MIKIYEVMDIADKAYIMHEGKLIYEISENDRYTIEGKEIIFGAEEPLIAYKTGRDEYFRFQSAYVSEDAKVDKIPLSNLYKVISLYNVGYNISKNIAKCVEITNKIYINKEKRLSGQEMASKEYARIYVETVNELKAIYEKLKIGWLGQILKDFTNSLVYTKGKAFQKSSASSAIKVNTRTLNEYTFNLKAGSILCEEGDEGHEMFILNRGALEVYIGGKKVADINEPGTVIGEMALLLGEKRTATIKTISDCNITIIKPEDLRKIAEKDKSFFLNLAVNMSKRLEHNCYLIRETNEIMRESKKTAVPLPPKERTNYRELLNMLRTLERFQNKYKNEWLDHIIRKTKSKISKIRDFFKT